MSWLDKTGNSSAANATAAPLYAEIDNLNRDIRQYKHLLQTANEEIDDKLRKLDGAGNNVVSMAKELELAKRRIRELERGSTSAPAESAVVRELRAVRDEVTNERSALMKRLKDIQEVGSMMILGLTMAIQLTPVSSNVARWRSNWMRHGQPNWIHSGDWTGRRRNYREYRVEPHLIARTILDCAWIRRILSWPLSAMQYSLG